MIYNEVEFQVFNEIYERDLVSLSQAHSCIGHLQNSISANFVESVGKLTMPYSVQQKAGSVAHLHIDFMGKCKYR